MSRRSEEAGQERTVGLACRCRRDQSDLVLLPWAIGNKLGNMTIVHKIYVRRYSLQWC